MSNDDLQPATRADLTRAIESITAAIEATAAATRAEIQAAEERAQEFARSLETNLLTAFHGHAKGQTARLHTAEVTAQDLATRISALEERVLNIETRRPPQ